MTTTTTADETPAALRHWQNTYSGIAFHPFAPVPSEIAVIDIAHALARQGRYAGHATRFISVAEHSWLVSRVVEQLGGTRSMQLAGLLHDAAEAFLGDMTRAIKTHPAMAPYRALELSVERCIAERFDLPHPWPAVVRQADDIMLRIESDELMPRKPRAWMLPEVPPKIETWWQVHCSRRLGLTPEIAEAGFLARWLYLAEGHAHGLQRAEVLAALNALGATP